MSLILYQFNATTNNWNKSCLNVKHEYMSYMAKKTQKRQTTIISLSDSNQQELENIKQQREQMLNEYQEKKQGTTFYLELARFSEI